jgi:hypothetical protein
MERPGVAAVGLPPPRPRVSSAIVLLGDDLLEWILLALGGALLVGNVMALVRPPEERQARAISNGHRCSAASCTQPSGQSPRSGRWPRCWSCDQLPSPPVTTPPSRARSLAALVLTAGACSDDGPDRDADGRIDIRGRPVGVRPGSGRLRRLDDSLERPTRRCRWCRATTRTRPRCTRWSRSRTSTPTPASVSCRTAPSSSASREFADYVGVDLVDSDALLHLHDPVDPGLAGGCRPHGRVHGVSAGRPSKGRSPAPGSEASVGR